MPKDLVDDYQVLVSVGHPVRRRLLDLVRARGPMTTSALAEHLGVAVGSASHHAKVLAGHGLLVPAPERARDRRERWWKLGDASVSWSLVQFEDDPAGTAASSAAENLTVRLQLERLEAWRTRRASAPRAWQELATSTDIWLRLTPEELAELSAELTALLRGWEDRAPDDGDPERRPVFAFAHAFPAEP